MSLKLKSKSIFTFENAFHKFIDLVLGSVTDPSWFYWPVAVLLQDDDVSNVQCSCSNLYRDFINALM